MEQGTRRMWRSRWAAIGAALAVTFGAGGLFAAHAETAPSNFVAISPVRVLDTRLAAFGGALTSASPRLLDVTGTISVVSSDGTTVSNDLVVPDGATAIVANVTVVSPSTAGFVSVRPGTAAGTPTTSSVNFTSSGVVVPNAVTVEVPTSGVAEGEIQLWFQGLGASSTTHLLVDVVGYYLPAASGATGPAGPAGPQGPAAWDVIPSGTTVTGNIAFVGLASGNVNLPRVPYSVDFPASAPVPLLNSDVVFNSPVFADWSPACDGTAAAPTAPPGTVCVYWTSQSGLDLVLTRADAGSPINTRGFQFDFRAPQFQSATTSLRLYASWAYTAP